MKINETLENIKEINTQLEEKANLNEIYVTDFGAKGDGITDDTSSIKNAIDSANNCSIIFPKGVYIVSSTINLKSNIKLTGNKAIIKSKSNLDESQNIATMFLINTLVNVSIENIEFDGNKSNQPIEDSAIHSYRCFRIINSENINIKNNNFHDFKHKAIDVFSSDNKYTSKGIIGLNIESNIFKDVWSACTITESTSKDILFSNNIVENCQEHGFTTYPGCSYVRVLGNSFKNVGLRTMNQPPAHGLYNYGSGIRLLETKYSVVSNNIVENPRYYGIRVTTNEPISYQKSEYVTVSNNIIYGGERLGDSGNGLDIIGNNIIVNSNIIKDFKALATTSGIIAQGEEIVLNSNTIENCNECGIAIKGNKNNVSNNIINNITKWGIQLGGTNPLTKSNVSNNIISSTSTTERGIYVQSNATELFLVGNNFQNITNDIVNFGKQILFIDGAYYSSDIPTTGTYRKGDRIRNSNPGSGKPIGWICLYGGTPGTWVVESTMA